MVIGRTTLFSALAVFVVARVGQAQAAQLNLQVDVQPTASFLAGNVTRVSYIVANTPRSTDRLFEFAVQSPVPVWRLEVPVPRAQYVGTTQEGSEDVASWGWLDEMPRPGESSPVLAYEAIGLPGIVNYRALRYFGVRPAAQRDLEGPEQLRFDSAGTDYIVGQTVGVVLLPTDLRPPTLAGRLRDLVNEACRLGWVDGPTTCQTLRAHAKPSARALRVFHRELVTQRGKAVGETAFALLAPNAEFLLSRM